MPERLVRRDGVADGLLQFGDLREAALLLPRPDRGTAGETRYPAHHRSMQALRPRPDAADMAMCYMALMAEYRDLITVEPGKKGGRPCIRGTRIAVADILGWLAAGMSHDEIRRDYPELTEEDIRAALAYAADRERRVVTSAA